MMWIIVLIILLEKGLSPVHGVHFNGGTITWRPLNTTATGTPVAIVITQTYLWSYMYFPCNSTIIANNQLLTSPYYPGLNTITLNCIANCGNGSTGYVAPYIISYCTDFSTTSGISFGQRSDTVYLEEGDDFAAAYQSTYWRALATSNVAPWSIATRLIIQPRSDNGLYNSAPVSTMMSPIIIIVNKTTIINVPVSDADGDTLRCRWSMNSSEIDECGGVCPPSSLPSGTVIYPTVQ